MAVGMLILIFCNLIVLAGWELVPLEVYMVAVLTRVVSCFVLGQAIPFAIKSNELSESVLRIWKRSVATINYKIRYWPKVLVAKRPVSFYYAMTKFEKDTKGNYYSTVVESTVDLLIVMD